MKKFLTIYLLLFAGINAYAISPTDLLPRKLLSCGGSVISEIAGCACRKLDPDVMLVQSAEDRQRKHAAYSLDGSRQR